MKFCRFSSENLWSLGMLLFVSYFCLFAFVPGDDLICCSSLLLSSELCLLVISSEGVQIESEAAVDAVPMSRLTIIESSLSISYSFEGVMTDEVDSSREKTLV